MKDNIIRTAVCPLCGRTYHGAPALSREDNKTLICPDCGTRQALRSIGVDTAEQEQIIGGDKSKFVMVDNMEWFNVFGLIFIAVIMIPNVVFAIKCKDGFDNKWNNKYVEVIE